LGLGFLMKSEATRGGGWLARAQRPLDDLPQECVEHGYLLMPSALLELEQGDVATAHTMFIKAEKIGDRFHEPDLIGIGLIGNAGWVLMLVPIAALFTHLFNITGEERSVEQRFSHTYRSYQERVRRRL
jgi:hypothetical protein